MALAGGWRDLRTLETAYTQADEATVLAVVTEPRKLREAKQDAQASAGWQERERDSHELSPPL